ncbi:hypothetical protein K435DRAFT_762089 [Dendrothele bispora CBS 962.96]|uniref:C2H2-type domain-containing protein n=1 Tax=Dendrothele bispora (strain CBS 962.96) TaxID=1314807 RepID=A0A4S8LGH2_DENBC|nr:hypothetical protein K435DRAFT_762089 [Dendrothele bispora CBS 962.96]
MTPRATGILQKSSDRSSQGVLESSNIIVSSNSTTEFQKDSFQLDELSGSDGDNKKHRCPRCYKCFNRPSSLQIHMTTHNGSTPYHCPYPGCGRMFSVNSNMRRHYRLGHQLDIHTSSSAGHHRSTRQVPIGQKGISVTQSQFMGNGSGISKIGLPVTQSQSQSQSVGNGSGNSHTVGLPVTQFQFQSQSMGNESDYGSE